MRGIESQIAAKVGLRLPGRAGIVGTKEKIVRGSKQGRAPAWIEHDLIGVRLIGRVARNSLETRMKRAASVGALENPRGRQRDVDGLAIEREGPEIRLLRKAGVAGGEGRAVVVGLQERVTGEDVKRGTRG